VCKICTKRIKWTSCALSKSVYLMLKQSFTKYNKKICNTCGKMYCISVYCVKCAQM